MTKVCIYVMTNDSGLAPNPFHDVCTLALCTPNHVRANLKSGDYIIGLAGTELRKRLNSNDLSTKIIYCMKIDKRIDLNSYYIDSRFRRKIPRLRGTAVEMCGDNFHKMDGNRKLVHTEESMEHITSDLKEQDIKGDRVFLGEKFWYFGSEAIGIPLDTSWGEKIENQLRNKSRGITYILGGNCRFRWIENDLCEFLKYISAMKLQYIPCPTDFDEWVREEGKTSKCAPYSKPKELKYQ